MLYFAYGSNMDPAQIRERCPSANFVAVASLPKHALAFTRTSQRRKCGVADAVPEEIGVVWGAVFDIPELEIAQLDQSEGYRPGRPANTNAYQREQRRVFREGVEEAPLLTWVYFANREANPPLPSKDYKQLIVRGAHHWNLPPAYIAQLEAIKTSP